MRKNDDKACSDERFLLCRIKPNRKGNEMSIDTSGLSATELKELVTKIEKRIVEVEKETLQAALKEMRAVADKLGVAFEDVIALNGSRRKKAVTKSSPKYANPNDPAQTWTGRGRKPAWVKEALDAGKSIEDLAI